MLSKIKSNWPTLLAGIVTVIAPVLVAHGILTVEQVGAIGALAGPAFTAWVHRMEKP